MGRVDFKVSLIQSERLNPSLFSCPLKCFLLTRLTNAFSKNLDNFKRAMDLYFCYYNFVRFHRTIRTTPAMECGVVRSPMTVKDFVEMAQ